MASAETHPDPETIADELSEIQREILLVFRGDERGANTHDITTSTGYDNRRVANHIKGKLADYDLVYQDGKDESVTVGPHHPNKYYLTPVGEDVLGVYRQRQAKTEADISRVDELADSIEGLEEENRRLKTQIEQLEERAVNEERFKSLKERLENEYWDSITNEINTRIRQQS